MTNKEAMHVLDEMSLDLYMGIKDLGATSPFREVICKRIEAIERAQDAMRQWDDYLTNLR